MRNQFTAARLSNNALHDCQGMISFSQILDRFKYESGADRIGPDTPFTHWRLYFNSSMTSLCREKFASFGDKAEFRPGAYAVACSRIRIGNRVVIRPQTMLFADPREGGAEIVIEDDVLIGSGVHVYVGNHCFGRTDQSIIDQGHAPSKEVRLRKGCWIGAQAVILPGVEIGENTVIGAGSVVTRSMPAFVVAAGNPARVIRKIRDEK
jgi:acetyltransferase-like isoleucine patch superfamily enzyme